MSELSFRERTGTFLSTVSLVLWSGGLMLMGALVARHVFLGSGLPREAAAAVMAPLFLGFDRWIGVLMLMLIAGEFLRVGARPRTPGMFGISAVLLLAAVCLGAVSILQVDPQIEILRRAGVHRGVGDEGMRFERLHRRSEAFAKGQVVVCLGLLGYMWFGPSGRVEEE